MGHDVKYYGKLTPKNPLSDEEKALFEELQDDDNYDRLYALEYEDGFFTVNDSNEKLYADRLYSSIAKYVAKLKDGGNDLIDGSYLVSCSECGLDNDAIILLYKNGSFIKRRVMLLVEEFVKVDV